MKKNVKGKRRTNGEGAEDEPYAKPLTKDYEQTGTV